MQDVQRDILSWDYHSIMQGSPGRALKGLGMKRVPIHFGSLQDYCKVFRVLLLEELKAHLLQVSKCSCLLHMPMDQLYKKSSKPIYYMSASAHVFCTYQCIAVLDELRAHPLNVSKR